MNHNEFDKQIKNKLSQYESTYSGDLWANIEKSLDNNPKRALPYFSGKMLLLSGSLLMIICAVGYAHLQNMDTKKLSSIPNSLPYSNNRAQSGSIENENIEIEQSNTFTFSQGQETKIKKNVENNSHSSLNNSDSNLSKNSKNKISYNSKAHVFQATNKQDPASAQLVDNADSKNLSKIMDDTYSLNSKDFAETKSISTQKIMSVEYDNMILSLNDFIIPDPKGKCPKFYTNVPQYFIETYLGPEFNSSVLTNKDSEFDLYKNLRINSESSLLGYNMGFRIGMEFRNGFVIKSGMNLSNMRNRLDFKQNNVEILKYKVVPSDTIHGNGTVAYVFDTISYIEKGVRSIRNYNSIKSLEIPLWVGFQKEYIRWSIALNTGVSLQMLNIQTGKVISHLTPQEPVEFTNSTTGHYEIFKRSFGIGLLASSQIGYKIAPNYQLIFEPYVRYYPRSITVNEYPLKQNLFAYGVNLGIKLGF